MLLYVVALLIYLLIFFLKAYKILLKSDNERELCCRYLCSQFLLIMSMLIFVIVRNIE